MSNKSADGSPPSVGLQKVCGMQMTHCKNGQRTRKALPSHTSHLKRPPSFRGGTGARVRTPAGPAARSTRPAPAGSPASTGNFTTPLAHSRAETHGPGSSPCLEPLRGGGPRWGKGAAGRGRDPHPTDLSRAPPASLSGCPCLADSDGRRLASLGSSGCGAAARAGSG